MNCRGNYRGTTFPEPLLIRSHPRTTLHSIAPNQGTTFTRHCVSPRTPPHSVTCNSFIPLFFILTTHQLREIRPFNQYSLILICRWNIYSLGFPNRLILSPSTDLVFETILPALFTINPLLGTPPRGTTCQALRPAPLLLES